MRNLIIPSLLVTVLNLLAQCGPPSAEQQMRWTIEAHATNVAIAEEIGKEMGDSGKFELIGSDIRRIIDDEAGVACWYTSSDIDCMPLGETNLKR